MNRILTATALTLSAGLAACAPTQAAPKTAPQPAPTTPAPTTTAPAPTFKPLAFLSETRKTRFTRAEQVTDPARTYRAVLNTSKGPVTLELNAKAAPVAVNNFVFLALNHFYDGTRFHRVIDGFMAQGGDPLSSDPAAQAAWGTGGPGYQFMAEHRNGLRFDRAGVLGMARGGSLDSQGSQFFITLAPADFLSGEYTVFGKVVGGQDALNRLTRNYVSSGPIPGAGADTLQSVQIFVLE